MGLYILQESLTPYIKFEEIELSRAVFHSFCSEFLSKTTIPISIKLDILETSQNHTPTINWLKSLSL